MVSLAHLITLLSVLVAVSRADEESGTKGAEVDAKWFRTGGLYGGWGAWGGARLGYLGVPWINNWAGYLGGCYGGAFFPSYYSLYFAKATEAESHSVNRRATRLDAEHLFRREEADKVSCINDKGVTEVFSKSECAKAADTLREKNVHSASSGNCKLSLVNAKDKVVAKNLPDQTLQKAVQEILKTCGQANEQAKGSETAAHVDEKQVVMLLSKA
ncbi:hypothetical protein VP01_735g6 [Puccinia sorghi]|uniref:Uncharacterized protein n=1 Tax=Puccinia sorghi TaxID=27349 RepID=A0A0L6UCM8_9BASI|nr:hypothetical protein VP01_735g6 [Puccinia sorghi]